MDSLIRFSEINQSKPFDFHLILSSKENSELTKRLDLFNIKKVSFKGILYPQSLDKWSLKAELRATVKQKCVITFKPVKTIVYETVSRTFSPLASQNANETDDDGIKTREQKNFCHMSPLLGLKFTFGFSFPIFSLIELQICQDRVT